VALELIGFASGPQKTGGLQVAINALLRCQARTVSSASLYGRARYIVTPVACDDESKKHSGGLRSITSFLLAWCRVTSHPPSRPASLPGETPRLCRGGSRSLTVPGIWAS
jgi:hypothetical protein